MQMVMKSSHNDQQSITAIQAVLKALAEARDYKAGDALQK